MNLDSTGGARTSQLFRQCMVALVPAAMLLTLMLRAVWDVDIFWQLKLGELILAKGGPVFREPFAALHLGEPLPTVAWAGQAIMAKARLIGGWNLLRVIDALCWLGGFWVVAAACRCRGAKVEAVIYALILAFLVAWLTASVRPQSFACLCFGLLLAIRRLELGTSKTIGLAIPLFVMWQNLHPSVTIGVAAMGFAALPGWVAWWRDRRKPMPVAPTSLAIVGALAIFATPDGISILQTSARNAEASVAIGASEWLPLWISANRNHSLSVLAVTLVTGWLIYLNPKRIKAEEVAIAVGLLLLTITAYRFVLFWSVAMVPVIARAVLEPEEMPRSVGARRVGLCALPVLAVVIATPVIAPTRFASSLPLSALSRLRATGVTGTIYGDFPFGGAIIDMGYPDWRVAYDGRYYRYSRKEWQYNGGIENGIVPLVDVIHKWNPAAFVLDDRHNTPLAGELARNIGWQRIWSRDGIVVYVPRRR